MKGDRFAYELNELVERARAYRDRTGIWLPSEPRPVPPSPVYDTFIREMGYEK